MSVPFIKTNFVPYATIDAALAEVRAEIVRSIEKHGAPFHTAHEGISVLREEFEETWDEVKADNFVKARAEAIQTAAMATRFIFECGKES